MQSVVLRIICDREREINQFKSTEYWEIETTWNSAITNSTNKHNNQAIFKLSKINQDKVNIANKQEVTEIEADIRSYPFMVSEYKESTRTIKPTAPYSTSKLQQDASTKLNFRAKKTMMVAQSLYEGIDIKGETVGLITYMRTDSTRISPAGLGMSRDYIKNNFSPEYLPKTANIYHSSKQAQDAHEAIRPTDVKRTPDFLKAYLNNDQYKLYKLIWDKFISSQMTPGVDTQITTEIVSENKTTNKEYLFNNTTSSIKFKGFRIIWNLTETKEKAPIFIIGEKVTLHSFKKEQKFTQPPARYTEASLIKIMEESGIGRPATYVPTMNTLDKRSYIERKGRQLIPTALGTVVNDMLVQYFPNIVDIDFTAKMEEKLDSIANEKSNWQENFSQFL